MACSNLDHCIAAALYNKKRKERSGGMREVKTTGRTVDEAVEAALSILGKKREDVEITVLKEGKEGVLGVFGGEEAEVEVKIKTSLTEETKSILQDILDKMGLITIVSATEKEGTIFIDISGDDLGRIIGNEGATLEALQVILSAIVGKAQKGKVRIVVDAGGYKQRRLETAEKIASEAVEKAKRTGKEEVLPPMPASERRAIHLFVKGKEGVSSFSRGEGEERRIVIVPGEAKEESEGQRESKGEG